jgi:chemotaxis signal transduction protein
MAANLRFRLQSGTHALPLRRIYRVAGFASLAGVPDEYFMGWLMFQGRQTPVFDLNRVVCDAPTLEEFGSRIILVEAGPDAPVPYVGLLAAGVTDTCVADDPGVTHLDIDLYLQMLTNFIPAPPAQQP